MSVEFPKHSRDQVENYVNKRWWLGLTLGDILDRVADVFPTREAVVDDKGRITFAELKGAGGAVGRRPHAARHQAG